MSLYCIEPGSGRGGRAILELLRYYQLKSWPHFRVLLLCRSDYTHSTSRSPYAPKRNTGSHPIPGFHCIPSGLRCRIDITPHVFSETPYALPFTSYRIPRHFIRATMLLKARIVANKTIRQAIGLTITIHNQRSKNFLKIVEMSKPDFAPN